MLTNTLRQATSVHTFSCPQSQNCPRLSGLQKPVVISAPYTIDASRHQASGSLVSDT
jgi:hypothetical protein